MKVLFIGGTGNISSSCVRLALQRGHEVFVLNRGNRPLSDFNIEGATSLTADIADEQSVRKALGDRQFDAVANFIAFDADDVQRDIRLFHDRCAQYLYISSASCYQRPLLQPVVTESTPLKNPFWDYSRKKIAGEEACVKAYRESDFPITIVRPSLTYQHVIPLPLGGWNDFTIVDRMRRGQPVVVHGDGTSLWTITHADDFAIGFVGLIGNQRAIGEAFHITSDELLTWDQIYDAVSTAAGAGPAKKVHIPAEFIARLVPDKRGSLTGDKGTSAIFDNSKTKRAVPEFKATTRFLTGIRQTIAWFEADPSRCQIRPQTNQMLDAVIAAYQSALDGLEPLEF